jgi:ferredoxin--NADP+ reductase
MLGLIVDGRPLMRAYSIASANHADHLEFLSIKVPDGPLTSRLRDLAVGDGVIVNRKTTGTLVLEHLLPGKRLYLLATGTGIAPFLAIVRDPETYERYEQVILVHGVRHAAELAYRDYLRNDLRKDEYLGPYAESQLLYHPTVTREPFPNVGRITQILSDGSLSETLRLPKLDPNHDRVMMCGSPAMLEDMTAIVSSLGFAEGSNNTSGSYVIEKAFVEK